MDRQIVYVGQIPQDTDLLLTNKNTMIGLGLLIQAILGTGTVVDGLACTPTGPATLNVVLGQGSIYEQENVDGTAYGSISADTSDQIMKQGILLTAKSLSCPAPSTTGFSINYLIEVAYQDNDTGSTVLPYYNASNPAVAYNGPNNTGVSQNTIRQGELIATVKPGTAATTGTQTTPAADAGYTGLWVVTVAYGQTAINSGNIAKASGAPFINYKLPQLSPGGVGRTILSANTTYYVSSSGNDSTGTGSSGAPWATLQHAINIIAATVDLAGFNVTINGNGNTYTVGAAVSVPWVGGGAANVIIDNFVFSCTSDCLDAIGDGVGFTYENCTFASTGTGAAALRIENGASCYEGAGNTYGAFAAGQHIFISVDASLVRLSACTISGSAISHIVGIVTAGLQWNAVVVTLTGPPAFSGGFANWSGNSSMFLNSGLSFSGSATGPQYSVTLNASINTNGLGALPGSTSGSTATGGQFI
jgi:hypothetical protein